jgi:AraC-like DNA-binding protein
VSGEYTFDEYSDKIRDAGALSLKTTPLSGRWDFAQCLLHQTTLQFGSEGSEAIIHGTTRSNTHSLFVQSAEHAGRIMFDGRIITWPEIVAIPAASHFTLASMGQTQWILFSVPTGCFNSTINGDFKKSRATIKNGKALIMPPAADLIEFIDTAATARKRIQFAPKQEINLREIEASLLDIVDRILSASVRESLDSRTEKIMSKALECLRPNNQIQVMTLARAAGVSERCLHRVFKKYFQVGPKRYLKIRQLNLVRRAVRQYHTAPMNVTGILTEHGVTEFGRFAIEYKALFGESPFETLHKYLVPRSSESRICDGV